jgi:hypothetical protein
MIVFFNAFTGKGGALLLFFYRFLTEKGKTPTKRAHRQISGGGYATSKIK